MLLTDSALVYKLIPTRFVSVVITSTTLRAPLLGLVSPRLFVLFRLVSRPPLPRVASRSSVSDLTVFWWFLLFWFSPRSLHSRDARLGGLLVGWIDRLDSPLEKQTMQCNAE
jgi:hypothetical protein